MARKNYKKSDLEYAALLKLSKRVLRGHLLALEDPAKEATLLSDNQAEFVRKVIKDLHPLWKEAGDVGGADGLSGAPTAEVVSALDAIQNFKKGKSA